MSDWEHEIEMNGDRFRWRELDEGGRGSRFEVQYYNEARREWRFINNPSSRDLFALGFEAGYGRGYEDA